MAKRKQLFHPDEIKKKIQTSQLINRLQDNAFADEEFLTTGQIKSIESLLDRTIPRLKAVDHTGDVALSGTIEVVTGVPRAKDKS